MKRTDDLVLVTIVFLADSPATAERLERESQDLDGGGAAWLWSDQGKPTEEHLAHAEQAEVFEPE